VRPMFGMRARRARRILAVSGMAAALVAGTAVPAFAHASFPAATAFGFAPNTSGGTGAVGSTPPYAAATAQTLYLRVPFEQTEPFNGSDDTTVDVQVIVPAGWTSPVCGAAKKQLNDVSTNSTNQPGADAVGWTCEVLDVGGHKVVHWSGPQVVAPQTSNDSAQFFVFSVTTPSPTVQTTYNGTGGTEGFIVDQTYASGEAEHWIPNAAFPGTPPTGSTTSVASGLARTVAAAPLPPPDITVTVPTFVVRGDKDATTFKVIVTNGSASNFAMSSTDIDTTIDVEGVAVADPITPKSTATKTLKPGKSGAFTFSWAHGDSLLAGDAAEVTSCVTVPTSGGPVASCGTVTTPDGTLDLAVTTSASTLTTKKTIVSFKSKITNTGAVPVLLRSSNVDRTVEVDDVLYPGTIVSKTDPAKRKLLLPGKSVSYAFTSTLPTLIAGDDVHVQTCVDVHGDATAGDNCSLVHLDIAK